MKMQKFCLVCSDCETKIEIEAPTKQSAIDIARSKDWAASRGNKKYYCPTCAPFRRNVGKGGGKRDGIQQHAELLESFQQLRIGNQ